MDKTYREMMEYVGDLNQLVSLKDAKLVGGFSDGVRVMEVANGGNLSATVLPDRCMNLYQVRYKGKNMNYLSPAGIVAPAYYDASANKWLRSFYVGMLTTCGLQNVGGPFSNEGGEEEQGLHGRIDNTPAENVKYTRGLNGDIPTLTLEGTMREARIFGENLSMQRTLEFEYEKDSIVLTDKITNNGCGDRQFVYALHLNYGYPLLDEGTKLFIDASESVPRNDDAAAYFETWQQIEAPGYPYPERCYLHKMKKDGDGTAQYTIFNEKLGIGVNVRYDGNALPYFVQWKMLGKGEYVMGLEPMNTEIDGPKCGTEGCKAPILAPGESITYKVTLNFIDKI